MFFRESRPDRLEPRRFRDDRVPFALRQVGGAWHADVAPGAELAVELFVDLAGHLVSPVTVRVDDLRHGGIWARAEVSIGDVRDVLVRLRPALARVGGVAVTLEAWGDILRLTPLLTVEVRAGTDRWRHLLEAQGLVPASSVPDKQWRKPGAAWSVVPEVRDAVTDAVERLGLEAVRP